MIAFAFAFVILAVTLPSSDCDKVEIAGGARGSFVFEILDAAVDMKSTTLCQADGSTVRPVALPEGGRVADISWKRSSGEIVILRCSRAQTSGVGCTVVGVDRLGHASPIFPPHDSPYFKEADGRLTPWYLSRARVSPDGDILAVVLNGRALIFRLPTGDLQTEFGDDVRELVWISGNAVALTKSTSPERAGLSESQVFVYHLDSGREEQITRFAPLRESSWNPFAQPRMQYPLARGLTWAPDVERLAFVVFPAGDLYELRDLANLHNFGRLTGQCYFQTAISADAKQLAYIAGTKPAACLVAGGDEVRLRNLVTGEDRTLMRVVEPSLYVTQLAWGS
jgi:hypothetical protein